MPGFELITLGFLKKIEKICTSRKHSDAGSNVLLPRLRNRKSTDDGNVELDLSEKFHVRGLENSGKAVDLFAQKLLNNTTLD